MDDDDDDDDDDHDDFASGKRWTWGPYLKLQPKAMSICTGNWVN